MNSHTFSEWDNSKIGKQIGGTEKSPHVEPVMDHFQLNL